MLIKLTSLDTSKWMLRYVDVKTEVGNRDVAGTASITMEPMHEHGRHSTQAIAARGATHGVFTFYLNFEQYLHSLVLYTLKRHIDIIQ